MRGQSQDRAYKRPHDRGGACRHHGALLLFGMAPSTFMREAALSIGEKPVRIADETTLRQILHQMKKQGGNLNQAIRAANAYGVDTQTARQLTETVRLVSSTASQLSNLISKNRELS